MREICNYYIFRIYFDLNKLYTYNNVFPRQQLPLKLIVLHRIFT